MPEYVTTVLLHNTQHLLMGTDLMGRFRLPQVTFTGSHTVPAEADLRELVRVALTSVGTRLGERDRVRLVRHSRPGVTTSPTEMLDYVVPHTRGQLQRLVAMVVTTRGRYPDARGGNRGRRGWKWQPTVWMTISMVTSGSEETTLEQVNAEVRITDMVTGTRQFRRLG